MGFKHPTKTCNIEGCTKPLTAREWCEKHYKRWQVNGSPTITLQSDLKGKKCLRCDKPARKVFLCNSHYTKRWREDNPEKALVAKRHSTYRRHLRKRNAEGTHTDAEWKDLLDRYEGLCAYCGDPSQSKDHVIPLARHGTDNIENILPACLACNKSKGDKLLNEWNGKRYEALSDL